MIGNATVGNVTIEEKAQKKVTELEAKRHKRARNLIKKLPDFKKQHQHNINKVGGGGGGQMAFGRGVYFDLSKKKKSKWYDETNALLHERGLVYLLSFVGGLLYCSCNDCNGAQSFCCWLILFIF